MPSQRKGRKSRSSAKKKKAYQAYKHREARRARRDRKSRRDFEAMCIASANKSFHRFHDLPFELREMVWEECIPSRLVFHNLEPSDHYDMDILRGQRRPPIISQVCHEARKVALRHGSRVTLGKWLINWEGGNRIRPRRCRSDEKAWFDTRRDTLLMYGGRADLSAPWLSVSEGALAAIRTSARLGFMRMYQSQIFDESNMVSCEWPQEANVAYVAKKYYLQAPLFAVVESGLYGLFGENKIIAVDLDDTATFRALKKVRFYGGSGEMRESPIFQRGKGYADIDHVPEIDREQIPEHGRARWLFEKFCSSVRELHELRWFFTENPEARLLALVLLCLDVRGATS